MHRIMARIIIKSDTILKETRKMEMNILQQVLDVYNPLVHRARPTAVNQTRRTRKAEDHDLYAQSRKIREEAKIEDNLKHHKASITGTAALLEETKLPEDVIREIIEFTGPTRVYFKKITAHEVNWGVNLRLLIIT
jgi:hypothetical protein